MVEQCLYIPIVLDTREAFCICALVLPDKRFVCTPQRRQVHHMQRDLRNIQARGIHRLVCRRLTLRGIQLRFTCSLLNSRCSMLARMVQACSCVRMVTPPVMQRRGHKMYMRLRI